MDPGPSAKDHYDRFLAEHYLWMVGGFAANVEKNRRFLDAHGIVPAPGAGSEVAVDLGTGCGFATVPLAEAGFLMTAVDFCRPLLDELLRGRDAGHVIEIVECDIMDFGRWSGRRPTLITCMGDTLTHLPEISAVRDLIRWCHAEIVPGGRLVLSFRDYSREPDGEVSVIPVRRDEERIFLCRLSYEPGSVLVRDVLYDCRSGAWSRTASEYRKLRLAPAGVRDILSSAGFAIESCGPENGMFVVIGRKSEGLP